MSIVISLPMIACTVRVSAEDSKEVMDADTIGMGSSSCHCHPKEWVALRMHTYLTTL